MHHKCQCHYIPPHVLDQMAKNADQAVRQVARTSALQAKASRDKRATRKPEMEQLLIAATAASAVSADRKIYDCQHQWQMRVKLARDEGGPATRDDDVNKAYDYAGLVRGYFAELNRDSYDNKGSDIILNVNYGVAYMNAFWDGDELTFGDGDGQIFGSFVQSLDVVAHEFAHGVTQFTANLDYFSQSGALNEHFSDVFGTAITQKALKQTHDTADWLIGNEIMGPQLYGEALRSMKAPGTAYDNPLMGQDPQPDHMDDYYAGPGDNQGVHINSGIPNKAFYIVASDIGTQEAARIWYHALQNLWPTANFNDAVAVIVESARILIRDGSIPEGTTQTVRMAFKDVGLPY